MSRKTLCLAIVMALPFLCAAVPRPAAADIVSTEKALSEMSIGKKDAPVTILAFESLTCPHCASFHRGALPRLKKEYIDTGKVRMVFIDYPLDARALFGTMVARCAGPDRYFGMIEIMFQTQRAWAGVPGKEAFLDALKKIGRMGGLTDGEVDKCFENRDLFAGIRKRQFEAQEKYKITATPTFVIRDKRIEGAQPFENFEKVLRPMLEGK